MKRIIKKSMMLFVAFVLIGAFLVLSLFVFLFATSKNIKFDQEKIYMPNLSIEMYAEDNSFIKEDNNFNTAHIKLNALPEYVPHAFISIEDKEFYKHHGLNYKRIVKAMSNNIKSLSIREGASTISQQLVKNTHLTNERSYRRKINEMLITKQMEKKFSKDQILESYLNVIYFGNGCYGIENASKYYFSKSTKDLTIDEVAMLAGMIKSPYNYSPIFNYENCINRRNLVLREMYNDKKISFDELNSFVMKPIELKINNTSTNKINTYSEAVLDEAINILNIPAKQIAISGYKIYTYLNTEKQKSLTNAVLEVAPSCDYATCSINIENGGIEAYVASSAYKVKDNPRQPGSVIKPILIYAPCLEECKIHPLTKINDEKINISGYSPKNISDKYYGYISINDCVGKSLNIPAIKCMTYIGIDKAKHYASKCGIKFDENDNGYALALGGMTRGVSVLDLGESYIPLANGGMHKSPKFIKYITNDEGKILYINEPHDKRIFRDDTAFLMTQMLLDATKSGTSKLLADCGYEVASKTGTVGIPGDNSNNNLDAWNVTYSTKDINCVWLGNMDNTPISYVGGREPVQISKKYFNLIYDNNKPNDFETPDSIEKIFIDTIEYEDHNTICQANDFTPTRYTTPAYFSKFNLPKKKSSNFVSVDSPIINGKIINGKAQIAFEAKDYVIYEVYKTIANKTQLVEIISGKDGNTIVEDKLSPKTICSYYIIAKIKNFTNNTEIISEKSNTIELLCYENANIINQDKSNNNKKWYV